MNIPTYFCKPANYDVCLRIILYNMQAASYIGTIIFLKHATTNLKYTRYLLAVQDSI